jgi:hypothetical protein
VIGGAVGWEVEAGVSAVQSWTFGRRGAGYRGPSLPNIQYK